MVLFSCLINVLFGLILMENVVLFSNACLILELMLCNENLTKFDILTLLSSNCRALALKLSGHLKKGQKMFLSSFFQFQLQHHFHRIGPLGQFDLVVEYSVCVFICCPLCMYQIQRPILPPLPEIGCPKLLELRHPWG